MANAKTDYESMSAAELTTLSAQLDDERAQLNERIAAVNEVRGRKEAEEDAARREAEAAGPQLAVVSDDTEHQAVGTAGVESAEGVGPK